MHKIAFAILLSCLLFGLSLIAMEDTPSKIAKKDLKIATLAYENYYKKIFGCKPCQIINSIFNEKKHAHVQQRISQLNELTSIIEDKEWLSQVVKHIEAMETYKSFKGVNGRAFKSSCLAILEKYHSIKPDHELCVICQNNEKNIIAFPCGHLLYCFECFKKHRQGLSECSLCRSEVKYSVALSPCCSCLEEKKTIFCGPKCHHFICQDCMNNSDKFECEFCKADDKNLIQVRF